MTVMNNTNLTRFPGFCDVHVHFREPGFFYKESIASGSLAAARGGYTLVFTMPNLDPVPDSVEHLMIEQELINNNSVINILPYGAITVEEKGLELVDMKSLSDKVVAFSDDGKGIQSEEMMRRSMLEAKSLNKIIAAHCEDNSLLNGGYIHAGKYAAIHGHRGIVSESEWGQIARDIKLAEETGCAYHVCHISTAESVELIRRAKARGVNITCETAPHYLLLCDEDIEEDGRFKMNPPVRDKKDRDALIEGVIDGTIDMIATDHAPHSREEKSKGLERSSFGVVGIETAFPLLYTYLVRTGVISMDRLLELLVTAPRKRFGLPVNGEDYSLWDLETCYEIDPKDFLSKGKATPFEGWKVYGKCIETYCNGKCVYRAE